MNKKILTLIVLVIVFVSPIFSQETDWKAEYIELLAQHEMIVDTLEDVTDDYEELVISYDTLVGDYENLFELYTKKQVVLDKTKEQMTEDQLLFKQMEDSITTLTKLVDPKYFTAFVMGGLTGGKETVDLGVVVDVPRIPISLITSANYTFEVGFGAKIGLGVQF